MSILNIDLKRCNKMTWKEKQEMRAERYNQLAEKAKQQSTDTRARSDAISNMIPFGQPILVGHHSEGRHRRDLERIHNGVRKSIELEEKAEYYRSKADNAANPSFISGDDENAINKLQQKLESLYSEREEIKARIHRGYELSNLSSNIQQVKKRIEHLEGLKAMPEKVEEINGTTIKIDKEINRVVILFPSKPNEEIRSKLKRNGFRWSPYNKAWQAYINSWTFDFAKQISKEV